MRLLVLLLLYVLLLLFVFLGQLLRLLLVTLFGVPVLRRTPASVSAAA